MIDHTARRQVMKSALPIESDSRADLRETCARIAGKYLRDVHDQPTLAAEVETAIRLHSVDPKVVCEEVKRRFMADGAKR